MIIVASFPMISITAFAASSEDKVKVSASNSKITVKINGVGKSGNADVIRMNANEYYKGDNLSGVSVKKNSAGTKIGTYTCGQKNKTISFSRYAKNGVDYLYCKYYVVQNGKILYGPVYATDIYAPQDNITYESFSKKGVFSETPSSYDYVVDLGCSYTSLNMNIAKLFYANEDKNGKPINNAKRDDAIAFESNGKTYYFQKNVVNQFDSMISKYSKAGINVTLILVAFRSEDYSMFPYSFVYTENSGTCMGINTSNDMGRNYWIAAMEFLASRYSRSAKTGLVNNYVLGNEIDYAFDYNRISDKRRESLDTYMEEYSRLMRLANLSVKKYCSDIKVTIPLTHSWAVSGWVNNNYRSDMYNSYVPKEMLDWLTAKTKAQGNYDWAIAPHCYGANLPQSRVSEIDTGMISIYDYVIAKDYNKTHYITFTNLEVLQQYLDLDKNRYNGETRKLYLTESGVSSCYGESNNNAYKDYENQAGYLASFYYKICHLDSVVAFNYYRLQDHETEAAAKACFGLLKCDGTKKISYDLYKYIDTEKTFDYANKYLDRVIFKKNGIVYSKANKNISNYYDTMDMVDAGFNWKSVWNEDKIIRRKSTNESINNRSLKTNKTSYKAGEQILVTATGSNNDWVGIYKADDVVNPNKENGVTSIYWYYVNKSNSNINHSSGKTYPIQVYGESNPERADVSHLPAGKYKVVLFADDYNIIDQVKIEITGESSSSGTSIQTNKSEYYVGEDIIVNACGDSNKWVGIYNKNDSYGPTTQPGNVESIYWYYVNKNGHASGNHVILQSTAHNTNCSNPASTIAAGDYVVYLFDETAENSYNVVDKVEIKIKEATPQALTSVNYKLNNDTDGFANGRVTVKCDEDNFAATDCVLYWADDNGRLEGYTSLAKFKLTGTKTVFDMYSNTIIPQGATRLLAYASNGSRLSKNYVEVKLPENCNYKFDNSQLLSEFQVISDVHVTTDQAAVGDVRYSNEHFAKMLNDVKNNSKNSTGIFINGDIANSGSSLEYDKVWQLYSSVSGVPKLHLAIGNHDWIQGNPNNQFQKYAHQFNPSVNPSKVYYDEYVDGYHYIYLGGEQAGLHANLSSQQLKWLDSLLEKDTKENPDKPVFVFLHQSITNTVAGSFDGQGWNGVDNEDALKAVIKKYGQVIMFNGHSHWELDSIGCMYEGSREIPTTFNTASVGYLWSSYNITTGEFYEGSHGYYIRVYKDKIVALGRDFVNGLWMPSAIFVAEKQDVKSEADSYKKYVGDDVFNLNASSSTKGRLSYDSTNPSVASVDSLGNVRIKSAGTADIIITSNPTDTKTVGKKLVKVTVSKRNQTVTASNFTKTYGDKAFSLNAKTNGNGKLTYKSSNAKVAAVDSKGNVTIKGKGTANITITAAKTDVYNSAVKTVKITVNPAAQTISAKNIKKTYGSKAFSIGAKVTKGAGKLSYKSSNTKVASISSSGKITIKGVGYADITITASAKGNYKASSKKIRITVSPKKVSISSLKKKSKTSVILKWKKDSMVTGYQIQYSASSSYKNAKTVKISKKSTVSKTISKLKKGKTYYVRIRSYKKMGNVTVYSAWSAKKIKL